MNRSSEIHPADTAMHVLTNGSYEAHLTGRGTGKSLCRGLALNRWSGDLLEDRQGFFIYLCDIHSGIVWSATPFPLRASMADYTFHATTDTLSWQSECDGITARLDVSISSGEDFEVRRLDLRNESAASREIEVTSFLEVVLHDPRADAGHPAFMKLFVQTELAADDAALLACRRPRANDERWPWMVHALAGATLQQWETDRARFIGRGRDARKPAALSGGARLSQTVGNVLDPAFSLRTIVSLPPRSSISLRFLLGMADDRAAALDMVRRWNVGGASIADKPVVVADAPSACPVNLAYDYGHDLRFFNGYGGFSTDGTEYVIHMPWVGDTSLRPPMPWVNVVGHARFGALVSESGSTCTWSRNSQANRLTPWSNDPVGDPHGEALFIQDKATGEFWSPLSGPVPAPCAYEVRHGFGRTRFGSNWSGLQCEVVIFVPIDEQVRVVQLRLTNSGGSARHLSIFKFERLVLGTLPPAAGSIHTICDATAGLLQARHPDGSEFAGSTVFAFATVGGRAPDAWHGTCDRMEFIGDGGIADPVALRDAGSLSGHDGAVAEPCFAQQVSIDLPAGVEIECAFFLGEAGSESELAALRSKYETADAVAEALSEVETSWRERLSVVQVETPMPEVDLMVNGWLAYQALVCRIWGRTAFYQSSGAYGYRDQIQDAAGLLLLAPEITREQLLLHARHQFAEGDVLHWWHPKPIERGLRTRFSDDLLWLPYVTLRYVQATGDYGVLDEVVPFLQGRALAQGEDEAYLKAELSGETRSIYEHCCRALDRSLTSGAHGLPLMGTGDWNDGMNRVGRLGRGESVWLGFFLYHILEQVAPLCVRRDDATRTERYSAYRGSLQQVLNDAGWDGEWYRRAYYDNGTPLGTTNGIECRIDGLAQAWAVISGAAPPDRAAQAMGAVAKHLVDEQRGIIRLLTPPFMNTPDDPGYIKGYVAGVRENGGQYSHAACWVVKAMAELGRNNDAARLLQRLSPVWHARDRESVERYKVEPYVIAADIYGEPPHMGRGGWTWYTGSAGWMLHVALESVLGLSIEDGRWLVLRPCVPDSWLRYCMKYRYRNDTRYSIEVTNPNRHARKVVSAKLDGASVDIAADGPLRIALSDDGAAHVVEVTLG